MVQKDYTKWNVDALTELLEGPLMNPKRLEEAFRVLKFGKRLISFFHPFTTDRFSSLRRNVVRGAGFCVASASCVLKTISVLFSLIGALSDLAARC